MRRTDREVTNFNEILDILRRAETIRLGLHDEPVPYVVPVSFGFEENNGAIVLYFHGAKEGRKHDLIAKSPHVCVEADIFLAYEETPGGITARYESVVGCGTARRVEGEEAAKGIDLLLSHCGCESYAYDPAALDATWVYRIELESITGKRNVPAA